MKPHLNIWGVGRILESYVQTSDCISGLQNCLEFSEAHLEFKHKKMLLYSRDKLFHCIFASLI